RDIDGLMYYKKSPKPRSFLLPKIRNIDDGGENCIPGGGFCLGDPTGCCVLDIDGLMYYKKSPKPRSFLLPKIRNIDDGVKTASLVEGFV
ncbi:hypothetical protein AG4045_020584, partial [Apium graveolens]